MNKRYANNSTHCTGPNRSQCQKKSNSPLYGVYICVEFLTLLNMGRCNISKEIWNGTTRCLGVPNSSTLKKGVINHFMRSFNKNVWHQKGSTCLSVLALQDGDKLPLFPQLMVRSQRAGTGNQVLRAPRYLLPSGNSECKMINQLETKCTRSSILTVTTL